MPEQPALIQCTLVAEPFDDPDSIFEAKLDGLRVLAWFDGHRLCLLSRQHKAQNAQFPDLIAALRLCLPCRVILDGEVTCLDAQGRSSFRQEFVIGGFTDPKGSRVGLGALLLGYYTDDGSSLIYAGKVGTGFTRPLLLDLRQRLDALRQERSPFDQGDPPKGTDVRWVTPALVAEIAFAEWTHHGKLRQPRFVGLRFDKHPQECRRERPQPPLTSETGDRGSTPLPASRTVQVERLARTTHKS
jgi:ATP-dependent DNA ligase